MSLDLEQQLREFFASAPQTKYRIEVVEISHSAMTKVYRLWREPFDGEVTTEDGLVPVQPMNFEIERAGSERHLDQVYKVRLDTVDVSDEFHGQLDRIPLNTEERIRIVLREYLSDDLADMQTRAVLQAESISHSLGAAVITAASPRLNVTRTGEIYAPRDVPMLRNFL
jgi:hypothetical protein